MNTAALPEKHYMQLQTFINSVLENLVVLDANGFIQALNTPALHLFGYTLSDICQQHIQALLPTCQKKQFTQFISLRYISARHKKGSTFWIELYVKEIKWIDRPHFMCTIRDITKQKEKEYAQIEATSDGYWDWLIQEDYEYMSPRFWEMFGYKPNEKKHQPSEWQDIIFPDDLIIALDNFDKHVATKGVHPFHQTARYRHKNGSTVHVICKGKVVEWDKNGQPVRMIGTHTDITELTQAQENLLDAGKVLENSLNEIYIFHEQTLKFLLVNKGARKNLGYSMETLQDLTPLDIKPKYEIAILHANLTILKTKKKEKIVFETTHTRRDGSTYAVEVHLQLAKYLNQDAFLAIVLDMTEQRRSEIERDKLIRELKRSNEELENFAYVASHDLRSPLVTCRGFIGYLKKDLEQKNFDKALDSLVEIEGSTQDMTLFIEDLLQYSRAGKKEEQFSYVNVVQMVRDLLAKHAQLATTNRIKIELSDSMPIIWASEVCIQQIFQNLIDNAFKYGCDNKQPHIKIGAEVKEREICYFVQDNGVGIAPEYHTRIFRLFERLQVDKAGSGAGLAIVKKAVGACDGRTWVQSAPQQGATFWIALPKKMPETRQHQI